MPADTNYAPKSLRAEPQTQSVARHLVDALAAHGTDRVFCVPGESYLSVLDALHDHSDTIDLVVCRQEGGAAMMAEADGKLTGRAAICMVTRGPGATNASAGLQVAMQDSTPMILFIGQVATPFLEREAFQEIDYRRMFGPLAKWVAQIDTPERVSEFVSRAFAVATSGRPGPVVLALPEDILDQVVSLVPAAPAAPVEIQPSQGQMAELHALLEGAQRPLVVVGGSRWTPESVSALRRFAERNHLPVVASFRRQDRFDNRHANYVGEIGLGQNPALQRRIRAADLVIAINARLGEVPSNGYELFTAPIPQQILVHIMPDADQLGQVYRPDLGIVATPIGLASALDQLGPVTAHPQWKASLLEARAEYEAWQVPRPVPGRFNLGEAILALDAALPDNAIFTNGAGNFSAWLHRFHRYGPYGTQLAPTSGSMGYGVPAAVAAKLRHPDRPVICIAGDGDFLMSGQELATAIQFHAAAVFVIVDNGMFGTIRMHQERHFPARVYGTDLVNPDFVAYGAAFGAATAFVEDTAELLPAIQAALQRNVATIIHVRTDPEALTAGQSLSQIRAAALG